ncbi:MAG: type III-B CRISPR module RAMP protein Cmr4 [Chloroflexi bacterium]|jgi:CRISPR-associated protein Cmr4|nr:type III-B CRISPR module RAMP protein Cmr4 [Chloroflexota bacterium]
MHTQLIGLLAETPVHVGAGQSTGAIDLPVAREAATDYPVVPGSGLKGALCDAARGGGWSPDELARIFGAPDAAGQLMVSDARILLLPVRSLTGAYRWATCPHLLERLARDLGRAGSRAAPGLPSLNRDGYLGAGPAVLTLEERQFTRQGDLPVDLVDRLRTLIPHEETAGRLAAQVVVLHDDDFAWFARYGLAVAARNSLDIATKTSKNLWYEESVPPDALFTALLGERAEGVVAGLLELFAEAPYLQVGGNESVGQGVLALAIPGNPRGEE